MCLTYLCGRDKMVLSTREVDMDNLKEQVIEELLGCGFDKESCDNWYARASKARVRGYKFPGGQSASSIRATVKRCDRSERGLELLDCQRFLDKEAESYAYDCYGVLSYGGDAMYKITFGK